jgi:hypothetical protein
MRTNQLIIALFQRFCWLDEGLQARLHDHGWPDVNRPQSMVKLGIVKLEVDPADRRHMIVSLTDLGARMRKDAQRSMDALTAQIAAVLGQDKFDALLAALEADWGDNIARDAPASRRRGV